MSGPVSVPDIHCLRLALSFRQRWVDVRLAGFAMYVVLNKGERTEEMGLDWMDFFPGDLRFWLWLARVDRVR